MILLISALFKINKNNNKNKNTKSHNENCPFCVASHLLIFFGIFKILLNYTRLKACAFLREFSNVSRGVNP